ncbi:hypothetical protein RQP46_006185 [Phenoliferia psychrophenolica]
MLENPQGTSGQPKIASFAPELIDEILGHLVAASVFHSRETEPLQAASFISRNWRGPAQRRLMERLTISSGSQAKRVAEGFVASGLDVYVKYLTIIFDANMWPTSDDEPTLDQITAFDGVGRDHFLALLPHFPTLTSLDLSGPTFAKFRPSDIDALQSSFISPRLTSLYLSTRCWHRDTDLAHTILSLTPSLTTLSLYSDGSDTILPHNSRIPVELPFLKCLDLQGGTYPSSFVDLRLLANSTIARVESLYWCDEGSTSPSANSLLLLMGPTLKSLEYTTYDGDIRNMASELQSCAVLECLDLYLDNEVTENLLEILPRTIHTLTLFELYMAHKILVNNFASRPPALKTLKLDTDFSNREREASMRIETEQLKDIVDTLKNTGVELVVTGEDAMNAVKMMV